MINFNRKELEDKIYACWIGKNIGGTLGGPFENHRGVLDCTGFTTEPGVPLPNDDLDLQLVWLTAVREVGTKNLNARVLGEYWLEYITPFWNEYGIAKANMRNGMAPPMAGQYKNYWKHSNGAWIRTELWATLYPGNVEKAIYFANEDACVDHGNGEGTYAAIFVAALEAAAFLTQDFRKLLDIGLSKIPTTCRMYEYIVKTIEYYDSGKTWLETRNMLTDMSLADEELGWFQSPANVSYAILGLLYGELDFKKSLLYALNCGDDTDCSCATAGSILGIMFGTSIIPEDWKEYIGDAIVTISINMAAGPKYDKLFPKSCTDLTDRIMDLHEETLKYSDITISDEPTSFDIDLDDYKGDDFAAALAKLSDYNATYESALARCVVELDSEPEIQPDGSIGVTLTVNSKFVSQKSFNVRWLLPEGWSARGSKAISAMVPRQKASKKYIITAPDTVEARNTIVAEVSCVGHFDNVYVPVVLLGK